MMIKEDVEKEKVIVNGLEVKDFIGNNKCKCGTTEVYYEKYDAYFCPKCNKWLESGCNDPNCEFCKDRPKKPLL